jgi:hypothetical protein
MLIYCNLLNKNKNMVYIDETSIDINLIPKYGYTKKNTPYIMKVTPKIKTMSLLAAVSKEKIYGYMIF